MDISTTGRTDPPVKTVTGIYFINIDGAQFDGTSVQIDWRKKPSDVWTPLNDEGGLPVAATAAYNKSVFVGEGELTFFLTGGTDGVIDLNVSIEKLPA